LAELDTSLPDPTGHYLRLWFRMKRGERESQGSNEEVSFGFLFTLLFIFQK
jgi:hypothetical protein